jgi:hypothetical protein
MSSRRQGQPSQSTDVVVPSKQKNIPISEFKSQISNQFSQNQGTIGEIVAASFNLSKPEEIDSLFGPVC